MKHIVFIIALLIGMAAVAADKTLVEAENDVQMKLTLVVDCTHTVTPVLSTNPVGIVLGNKMFTVKRVVSTINNDLLKPFIALVESRAADQKYEVLKSEEYQTARETLQSNELFARFGLCDSKRADFYVSLDAYLAKLVASRRK